MEKAKAAIRDFTSKAGHHDTTVHEKVARAVHHETVQPTRHEDINTAIDKEVHQDHYHHTVQPVHDKEVLPEKHTHNLGAVEHRDFDHRDHEQTKRTLAAETQQYKDNRVVNDTHHTKSHAPVVQGEHVHHHLHETIQPVVHKETIQPNVVHTTVPIHETHHNAAQHHATTALPPISMTDYKKSGGVLDGRGERLDAFEGEGKDINDHLSHKNRKEGFNHNQSSTGTHNGNADSMTTDGVHNHTHSGNGVSSGTGTHQSTTANGPPRKASLMDKLNPKTDSNGDGKAGFMK